MELAAAAIAAIVPLLIKGAEEFAKSAGKGAADQTGKLLQRLRRWWSGDEEAENAANLVAERPDRYEPILVELLTEEFQRDPALRAEIAELVAALPHVSVRQSMTTGDDVTGARVRKLSRGSIEVQQDIQHGRRVTGAEIDEV